MPPQSLRPAVEHIIPDFEAKLRAWRAEGKSWDKFIVGAVNAELAEKMKEPYVLTYTTIMGWAHDEYGIE